MGPSKRIAVWSILLQLVLVAGAATVMPGIMRMYE